MTKGIIPVSFRPTNSCPHLFSVSAESAAPRIKLSLEAAGASIPASDLQQLWHEIKKNSHPWQPGWRVMNSLTLDKPNDKCGWLWLKWQGSLSPVAPSQRSAVLAFSAELRGKQPATRAFQKERAKTLKTKGVTVSVLKRLPDPKQVSSGRDAASKMLLGWENTAVSGDWQKNLNKKPTPKPRSSLTLNYPEAFDRGTQLSSWPPRETPNSNLLCYKGCISHWWMLSAHKMITARADCHCKSLNSLEAQPSVTAVWDDPVYGVTRAPA